MYGNNLNLNNLNQVKKMFEKATANVVHSNPPKPTNINSSSLAEPTTSSLMEVIIIIIIIKMHYF